MELSQDIKEQLQGVAAENIVATAATNAKVGEPRKAVIDSLGRSYGTGRRKTAVARVWVKAGKGKIIVNDKDITEYFARSVLRMIINQPFAITKTEGQFDVICTAEGSGLTGQAGAVLLGISRALTNYNPDYRKALKDAGLLTRDSRKVERKKYGHKKARKRFQFSKR